MAQDKARVVYVVGAGLSAGLNFPTIENLLPRMWPRLQASGQGEDLANIIRFHHPSFNPKLPETFPNVELLLSEMEANAQLFHSSRPATGNFTSEKLDQIRRDFLLELAKWFHDLQADVRKRPPPWLKVLISNIKKNQSPVVSFNWDLILDEFLFGEELGQSSYGFGDRSGPTLIKPHGSLNWFERRSAKHIKEEKKVSLVGNGASEVFAFKRYRHPKSSRRIYMPLIVPPIYMKTFKKGVFKHLWGKTVSTISTATEVRFLGYSLPAADFHSRFILRCGFYNQVSGELNSRGQRTAPTGRARVTIVDPANDGPGRIKAAVGWECDWVQMRIEDWIRSGGLE